MVTATSFQIFVCRIREIVLYSFALPMSPAKPDKQRNQEDNCMNSFGLVIVRKHDH